MAQIRLAFEKDIREISRISVKAMGMLATLDPVPGPVKYQKVISLVTEIERKWTEHLRLQASAAPLILSNDPHFVAYFNGLERDGSELTRQLEALSSASWPRSSHAGLVSIRLLVLDTLKSVLRYVERERTTVLPLLRRWTPTRSIGHHNTSPESRELEPGQAGLGRTGTA